MDDPYLELATSSRTIWERYISAPAKAAVPRSLKRAWDRVRRLGADHRGLDHESVLDLRQLRERRERVDEVRSVLPEIVEPALGAFEGEDHLLVLADRDGVIVDTWAGGGFADTARRVRLIAGSAWSESLRGTNAIGTALAEDRPVSVRGAAHFARPHHSLSCYATPIRDPYGELVAVLDTTSAFERKSPLAAVAVLSLARAVEQALRERLRGELGALERALTGPILARFPGPAALIDPSGRVTQANLAALDAFPCLRRARRGHGPMIEVRGRSEALLGLGGDALRDRVGAGPRPTEDGRFELELEPVLDRHGRLLMIAAFFTPRARSIVSAPPVSRPTERVDPFAPLVGADAQLAAVRERAALLARTRLPILLLAETGTGKGALARCVHAASDRGGPFVAINCGAVSTQLLESELFGYAPGAFTGASPQGGIGRVPLADGGTLFLDEVAEMPPKLQIALLRFLDDGTYRRVGDAVERSADVRLICATCRDLPGLVADGSFRADLYYRIQGATLTLPPLRARADTLELAEHLLGDITRELGLSTPPRLSPAAHAWLIEQAWPGNVRQLKSALQFACVLAGEEGTIEAEHFPQPVAAGPPRPAAPPINEAAMPPPVSRDDAEQLALKRALEESAGNISRAARILGVARSTVYRMMRRYGLDAAR